MIKVMCETNEYWREAEKTLPPTDLDPMLEMLAILEPIEKYLNTNDCDQEGVFSAPIERCLEIIRKNQI